jgi:hypothetical protein
MGRLPVTFLGLVASQSEAVEKGGDLVVELYGCASTFGKNKIHACMGVAGRFSIASYAGNAGRVLVGWDAISWQVGGVLGGVGQWLS